MEEKTWKSRPDWVVTKGLTKTTHVVRFLSVVDKVCDVR